MTDAVASPAATASAVVLDRRNVAVVIPALNEALRIREVAEGALNACDHVIVIDDGSDADTPRNADLPRPCCATPRMCKGRAFATAFREPSLGGRGQQHPPP